MNFSQKISIHKTPEEIGKTATLGGWVFRKRDHGKVSFIDLRDSTGIIQLVVTGDTEIINSSEDSWGLESVILVEGLVKERPAYLANAEIETGHVEMEVKKLEVLSATTEALPLDISKDIDKVHLDTLFNYRALTLRNPKMQSIFRFSGRITDAYKEYLQKDGFTEIHTPKIIPSATEGGANVFRVDYFGKDVFLAQSPQFYKQAMVGVFEKVFEIGPVFRAEPHYTSRHINEIVMLDAEMGFISGEEDVMKKLEGLLRFMVKKVEENSESDQKILGFQKVLLPKGEIPRITLTEAVKIINQKKGIKSNDIDLDPEGEVILGEYAKEKFQSDFIFVTEYPVSGRPFYQMPSSENPLVTKSFDILFRGLELGTGSQRIHNPKELIKSMKAHSLDPKDFEDYLNIFRYGMPPHGGWGLGLERMTKQWLGLKNVRLASLFPRDVKRVSP